jgi:hypothetical protein
MIRRKLLLAFSVIKRIKFIRACVAARNMTEPRHDEEFCASCGEIVKKEAEICPECGTKQSEPAPSSSGGKGIPDIKRHELEKIANKDKTTIILVGILLSPVAYYMVGKTGLALLNFITFNYFLLGPIIVPIHCNKIINDAEEELRVAGVDGY